MIITARSLRISKMCDYYDDHQNALSFNIKKIPIKDRKLAFRDQLSANKNICHTSIILRLLLSL